MSNMKCITFWTILGFQKIVKRSVTIWKYHWCDFGGLHTLPVKALGKIKIKNKSWLFRYHLKDHYHKLFIGIKKILLEPPATEVMRTKTGVCQSRERPPWMLLRLNWRIGLLPQDGQTYTTSKC